MAVVQLPPGQRHWIFSSMLTLHPRKIEKQTKPANSQWYTATNNFLVIATWLDWFRQRGLRRAVVFIISPICDRLEWSCRMYWCDTLPEAGTDCVHKCRNGKVISIKAEVRTGRGSGDSELDIEPSVGGSGDRADSLNRSLFISKAFILTDLHEAKLLAKELKCMKHIFTCSRYFSSVVAMWENKPWKNKSCLFFFHFSRPAGWICSDFNFSFDQCDWIKCQYDSVSY